MKDYEQEYYNLLYENRNLKNKINELEQVVEIYKTLVKNKKLKEIIIKDFVKFLNNKK